jgi:hypothetical protein
VYEAAKNEYEPMVLEDTQSKKNNEPMEVTPQSPPQEEGRIIWLIAIKENYFWKRKEMIVFTGCTCSLK